MGAINSNWGQQQLSESQFVWCIAPLRRHRCSNLLMMVETRQKSSYPNIQFRPLKSLSMLCYGLSPFKYCVVKIQNVEKVKKSDGWRWSLWLIVNKHKLENLFWVKPKLRVSGHFLCHTISKDPPVVKMRQMRQLSHHHCDVFYLVGGAVWDQTAEADNVPEEDCNTVEMFRQRRHLPALWWSGKESAKIFNVADKKYFVSFN